MCRSFEVISGKKNKGDKGLLKGLTKMYRDAKYSVAIIPIPVELLEIDTRYQTEVRTDRSLMYLVNNWDENKLLPLIGVPHWEEGKVYLVDGYGRWVASQMVDKEKYTDLQVLLILNAPNNAEERLEFEAEMYAYQNKQVARMTAIQKHGAMVVLHDKATERLEKLKEKYGFEYASCKGNRSASVLGSYSVTLNICNIDDGKAAEFIFDICKGAGFDRKPNGYSTGIMKVLLDMYKLYSEDRDKVQKYLIKELRKITPLLLKARGVAKYPFLDYRLAMSLYVEDMIVDNLGLEQAREVKENSTKLVMIKKRKNIA